MARGNEQTEPSRDQAFLAYLRRASEEVHSWPEWKQKLLGGDAGEISRHGREVEDTGKKHLRSSE